MPSYLVNDGIQQVGARSVSIFLQRRDQAFLTELFIRVVERFRYAIGVERNRISSTERSLAGLAVPLTEESQNGSGGIQAIHFAVAAQQQRAQVTAVRVT